MAGAGRRHLRGLKNSFNPRPQFSVGLLHLCWIFVQLLLFLFMERATELVEDKGFACERAYMHAGEEESTQ